jgi:hypothetical protein
MPLQNKNLSFSPFQSMNLEVHGADNSSVRCTVHFFEKYFPFGIPMWGTGTCTLHSFSDLAILNVPSPQM